MPRRAAQPPAGAAVAADLTPGTVWRRNGLRGLWRAVAPCQDRTGRAWWFLPCDPGGVWDRSGGFRAFYPEDCQPPKRVGSRRHYRRRDDAEQA